MKYNEYGEYGLARRIYSAFVETQTFHSANDSETWTKICSDFCEKLDGRKINTFFALFPHLTKFIKGLLGTNIWVVLLLNYSRNLFTCYTFAIRKREYFSKN